MTGTLTPTLRQLLVDATQSAGVPFVLFQGSYSTAVGASAGTHSGGGAFDLDIRMMSHQQRLTLIHELRVRDCAAWIRTPEYGYHAPPEHIHGICWTEPDLSPAARQQVADYHAGRNGLADRGPDPHPQPSEDDMPLTDQDIDKIAQATAAAVNRVLGDYNAKGNPAGPNKNDPKLGADYIRQIRRLVGR